MPSASPWYSCTSRCRRSQTLAGVYAHFFPGKFIQETGTAKDIDYVELTLKVQF
jgi:hypothetical protein